MLADLNDTPTRLTKIKPVDAIKKDSVESKPSLPIRRDRTEKETLDPFAILRYLYLPGELEGGQSRATDPIWSLTTHHIPEVMKSNEINLYRLGPDINSGKDAPKRSFVREELLEIPIDTN